MAMIRKTRTIVPPGASVGYAEAYYEDDGQPVPPHVYEPVSADDSHCKICGHPWLKGEHLAPAHEEAEPEEKYSTAGAGPKSGVYESEKYGTEYEGELERAEYTGDLDQNRQELEDPPAKPKTAKKHK